MKMKNSTSMKLAPESDSPQIQNRRLHEFALREELEERAIRTMSSVSQLANRHPAAFSQLMMAVDFHASRPRTIVLSGDLEDPVMTQMLSQLRSRFGPQRAVALAGRDSDTELLPVLEGRLDEGQATRAFVCRGKTCGLPATTPEELAGQLS